uniref:SCP domain-containing protein n=1 Tax=Bursaphelenchus xylophilus TaxID=6326 RepID=A0A1I7RMQ9_BURXY
MRIIFFFSCLVLAISAFTQRRLTAEERAAILNQHNMYKRKVANGQQEARDGKLPTAADMRAYEYDVSIEDLAFEWASNCVWKHSSDHGGENIYAVSGEDNVTAIAISSVDSWFSEVKGFNVSNVADFEVDPNVVTGHFTQVIWGKSYRLGCAIAHCSSIENLSSGFDNGYFAVCNYEDRGNYISWPVYTSGDICSKCPEGTTCEDSLCVLPLESTTASVQSTTEEYSVGSTTEESSVQSTTEEYSTQSTTEEGSSSGEEGVSTTLGPDSVQIF